MDFLIYILQVSICLVMFYLPYRFLFRSSTFFDMNRFYLLFSLLAAIVLPALSFTVASIPVTEGVASFTLPEVTAATGANGSAEGRYFSVWQLLIAIYILGIFISSIKLIKSISGILKLSRKPYYFIGKVRIYNVSDLPSFSFLNLIFINNSEDEDEMKQVMQHELVHVRQFHSLDVLMVEVVQAVLWFNPIVRIYKNELKAVHEFIADKEAVKASGINHFEYGKLLLNQLLHNKELHLAHLFSNNHIKTRIIMLSKKRTTNTLKVNYLLAIPMFALAVLFFSCEGVVEEKEVVNAQSGKMTQANDEVYKVAEIMPEYPGGMDALMNYMGNNLKYPEDAKSDKVEGTVYVSFIINKEGLVEQVTAKKGVNEALDAEAVRVIKEMENWTPGYHNGKAVDVEMVLPVKFKL